MSWGGRGANKDSANWKYIQELAAIENLVLVAAAGNSGRANTVGWPANVEGVVATAALDIHKPEDAEDDKSFLL